jgi:hypothetical protein
LLKQKKEFYGKFKRTEPGFSDSQHPEDKSGTEQKNSKKILSNSEGTNDILNSNDNLDKEGYV